MKTKIVKPIKLREPDYLDYLVVDSLFYQKLRLMGYKENTIIMKDLKEKISEVVKQIGN